MQQLELKRLVSYNCQEYWLDVALESPLDVSDWTVKFLLYDVEGTTLFEGAEGDGVTTTDADIGAWRIVIPKQEPGLYRFTFRQVVDDGEDEPLIAFGEYEVINTGDGE